MRRRRCWPQRSQSGNCEAVQAWLNEENEICRQREPRTHDRTDGTQEPKDERRERDPRTRKNNNRGRVRKNTKQASSNWAWKMNQGGKEISQSA